MTEVNSRRRLLVIGAIVFALFAGLLTRLWFLQVNGGETLAVAAQRNSAKFVPVPAVRGTIYDAKGLPLAQTVPVTTLTVDRQKLTAADRVTLETNLGHLLGVDAKAVGALIDSPRYDPFVPVPVAKNVTLTTAVYVSEHRDQFPQVAVTRTSEREYPNGQLGANLVGYVGQINKDELAAHAKDGYSNDDIIGKTGVEQTFESELRGTPGTDKVVVNSQGRAVGAPVEVKKPQAGHDVQLTVDLGAQKIAEESLQQGMDGARTLVDPTTGYFKANAGAVVVLDARTGSVVAMASNPTYNPTDFISGNADKYFTDPNHPLIDRALNPLAPGSTFKLFTSIAMLQSGLYPEGADHVNSEDPPGCFLFGNEKRCNAGGAVLGPVSLTQALTESSDVYFFGVGNEFWNRYRDEGHAKGAHGDLAGDAIPDADHPVGNAMQHVLRTYGFGAPSGIGLPGDQAGVVPDHAYRVTLNKGHPDLQFWRRGDSASLAVGQGDVLVTPLQLADGYAAFANGGTLYMPRLASAVHANSAGRTDGTLGPVVHPINPQTKGTTGLTPETRQPIYNGLTGVIANEDGTAHGAFADYQGVKVIGKTGTAQVSAPGQDTSWFVAITNPDNDPALPQYVIVSMVEQGGFGASVSAPIVRRIIDYLNNTNQVPPPVAVAPATGNAQSF
jgi:penicillin-binding protein 2